MASTTPAIGQVLGRYRIIEQIGAGGMGRVFRAHDQELDRDVALKILPEISLMSEPARRQFRREALHLARITDSNVAMAFDFGRDQGMDYLVSEYVPGITLDAKLAGIPLSESEILDLGTQLASGLEAAHREGIIHRDLKPSNLRLRPDGKLKILDFGLASVLRKSAAEETITAQALSTYSDAGTPAYMAPEQVTGKAIDFRTDMWAAGAVLYEMSTGKRPFGNLTGSQLVGAIIEQEPMPPRSLNSRISTGLEHVIQRALKKDPEKRYQSAGDLRNDLTDLMAGRPAQTSRPPAKTRTWVALVALGCLFLAVVIWQARFRTAVRPAPGRILAVLPFQSLGNDPGSDALGLGLTETVTTKLVQVADGGHLQLVATRELIAQGIKTADQARREFGTDLVLEGSVQQAGNRIRVTCSLVNSATHVQLAARDVTGDVAEIFELQDRLFSDVADMLSVPLQAGQPAQAVNTSSAAYDYYLRGRGYLQEYQTIENITNAINAFKRVIEIDPKYAAGYASLGMAYAIGFDQQNQDKKWLDSALDYCQHALSITPDLAEGHTCIGNINLLRGQYAEAVKQLQRSVDLNHFSDETLSLLASAYEKAGDHVAAEQAFRKAISLRPGYWALYTALGRFYYEESRYTEAATTFRKAIELAPQNYRPYSNLGAIDLLVGRYDDAVSVLRQSIALRPSSECYGNLGAAYFYLRKYGEAAESLNQALKIDDKDWLNWGNLADTLYQLPNRRSEAVSAYRKATDLASARLESNPNDAFTLAFASDYYAMLNEETRARSDIARALELAPRDGEVLFRAAIVYNHFGDATKTVEYLRKSIAAGYSETMVRDTPDFEHLKTDPQFRSLLANSPTT